MVYHGMPVDPIVMIYKSRAKIKKGVRPYGGTIQKFVRQDSETVVLSIGLSFKTYLANEIEWIKHDD